ncbi:MAG TPA: hypothetical protein VFA33_22645 [Bryobacteraceae bacterium]|nr:hypothetical protein [Bryobacteraceae bacterium]
MSAALAAAAPPGGAPGTFEELATYRGLGSLVASSIGPGPTPASERLYLSYLYLNNTIEVVSVDPATGSFQVFSNPAPTESGARNMVVGPDGKIYLGTLPNAHLLQLDPRAGKLIDLGRPSQTESYIWDVAVGPDRKIYGATYPQAKLVRYDPATNKLEDLGRMDPVEQYAHSVAGTGDFVYVGIGTSKANIAVYQISTGQHREILPADAQVVAQATVYMGQDGKVYGRVESRCFRLEGWTCTPIPAAEAAPAVANNRLRDGRSVTVEDNTLRISDPRGGGITERKFGYQGNTLPVFRVAFGPDDRLYGSTILPIHLVRFDEAQRAFQEIGGLGGGEVYSFLTLRGRLLMGAYSGLAPLMSYDPAQAFHPGVNPVLVEYAGQDHGWRPEAMIAGPDGRVYLGPVAGYGRLGGPLTIWDPATNQVTSYPQLVQDQSPVSLARAGDLIAGGTTVGGGGGSHPTQTEAKLFLWDPQGARKIFETVPVARARNINDLIAGPDKMIYGIAGQTLFVFDPATRQIVHTAPVPFHSAPYNSVAVGADGGIWGLAREGIFRIDPRTRAATLVASAPRPITAGFDLRGGAIYFTSEAVLYRYHLPAERK